MEPGRPEDLPDDDRPVVVEALTDVEWNRLTCRELPDARGPRDASTGAARKGRVELVGDHAEGRGRVDQHARVIVIEADGPCELQNLPRRYRDIESKAHPISVAIACFA